MNQSSQNEHVVSGSVGDLSVEPMLFRTKQHLVDQVLVNYERSNLKELLFGSVVFDGIISIEFQDVSFELRQELVVYKASFLHK